MKIEKSTDWNEVSGNLSKQLDKLSFNNDLHKLKLNINRLVSELSVLEVEARRTKKPTLTEPLLNQINEAIDRLEKLIIIATLMS